MKNLFIVLAFLCFQNVVLGQGWQKILKDSIRPEVATNAYDGGYIVAGYTDNNTTRSIIKIDAKGNRQWAKNFPDFTVTLTPIDFPLNIIQTPDSAYLLYGADRNENFVVKKLINKAILFGLKYSLCLMPN